MKMSAIGCASWWQNRHQAGIPEVSAAADGECDVTFWWRDPSGANSALKKVWIYITGVTDHHQRAQPRALTRIAGTDAWFWRTRLPAHWRGSYCFIPSLRDDDFPVAADGPALREGWRRLLAHAQSDPFNPLSWKGGRGHPVSGLSLPEAPPQPGWDGVEPIYRQPQDFSWRSAMLGNTRRAWLFETGEPSPDRPLALLLDGQFWAQSMPVWPALERLTAAGTLPPAVYLLVDSLDTATRSRELPCNPQFWQAVEQELLAPVRAMASFSERPEKTLVAGQSFGGLSALYAALTRPHRYGGVISQSGSFWWPERGNHPAGGWLTEQVAQGALSARGLRIWLGAGYREPLIMNSNRELYGLLQSQMAPGSLIWRPNEGGHDALCWRGGLTEGLIALWST